MRDRNTRRLTLCSVMTAMVFVMTWMPRIPVPVTGGYVHPGDGAVFLAVMLLGPLGIPAAGIGSALADLAGGYILYALPTLMIKAGMAVIVWKLAHRSRWAALAAFLLAEALMVAGYFAFECMTVGSAAAFAAVLPNVIQGAAGCVLGMVCRMLLPRLQKMMRGSMV